MRPLAGLLVLALVGLPLLVAPSALVAAVGAAAAALGAVAVARLSLRLATAGATLAVLEYALALWLAAASPEILTAVAIAVALAVLLDVIEFAARSRDAAMDPRLIRRQVRYWVGSTTLGAAVAVALAVGGGALGSALPAWGHPAAAAVGVLVAFGGAVGILMDLTTGPGESQR
jgi:hypothetical protein